MSRSAFGAISGVSSRQYLDLIERSAAIGTWVWDPETDELSWSENLHRLMQTDPATYRPCMDDVLAATHPDDRWLLREQMRPGAPNLNTPTRVILPDGRTRWHSLSFEAAGGGSHALIGVVQDVTEAWTAESLMRQRAKLTDTVLRLVGGMLWRAGPDGILNFETGWCEFTGTTMAENVNGGWLKLVHPDDRAGAAQAWHQARSSRSLYSAVFRARRFDGVYCRLDVKAAPHFDNAGNVIEWIGYCAPASAQGVAPDPSVAPASDEHRPTARELKAARALLGMSVNQLAEASGVSAATIARHEAGDGSARVRPRKLARVRDVLTARGVVFGQVDQRLTLSYLNG